MVHESLDLVWLFGNDSNPTRDTEGRRKRIQREIQAKPPVVPPTSHVQLWKHLSVPME